ncbi:YjbH domain-containing protein [Azospirillum sp. TSO22-1]|uniref:YjbH domain-containing protein n=1 Tax=Azospirillum sp. TSO22-1 TaxID=716789 RepID=UPI000D61DE38|nr:YjbH domain-containing protein [Azospirillum sp. TSO22-1]PWC53945.1 hypothetical protein TSO221_09485 [Azospirillum sp. TSO22-1]
MNRLATTIAFALLTAPLHAEGLAPSLSDWGGAGLMLNPTARMMPEGTATGGVTLVGSLHRHLFAGAQLLPWLEVTARDTMYPNWWGLSDPGLDVKVRLLREGPWWPAVAVGGRDVTGSGYDLPGKGRFAGEYVVLSRRFWNLDASLGLGWGRFAGGGGVVNPLGGRFAHDRDPNDPRSRGPRAWFTGREIAPFGGVEWHTPLRGLSLKLEYSGDGMRAERQDDPTFVRGLPVNVGLAYRPWPWLDIGAGVEQGKRAVLRLAVALALKDVPAARPLPPPGVGPRPEGRPATSEEVLGDARAAGLPARGAVVTRERAVLWLDTDDEDTGDFVPARILGRAARVLADGAPAEIEALTVVTGAQGLDGIAVTLQRRELERALRRRGSAEEILRTARVEPASAEGPPPPGRAVWRFTLRPTLEQSLFEQGVPYASRTYTDAALSVAPWRGLVIGGGVRINLASSVALLDTQALPAEQPVRSDLALYTARVAGIEHLHASWLASPAPGLHTRLSVGHFEEMFGGFGAEALYQPPTARWAAGLDLNRVWKRPAWDAWRVDGLDGHTTGHLSLYWESDGAARTAVLRLGRYLGGDWGGTAELAHRFDNGVRLSAQMTWTEGPDGGQSRIGGRLDQGIALVVPIGERPWLPDGGALEVATRTLGRDAGQRLRTPLPLYETLVPAGYGRLAGTWSRLLD